MTETELPTTQPAPVHSPLRAGWKLASIVASPWRMALVYLAGLTLAEVMTTLIEPRVGMVMHGLVLVGLFVHAALWARSIQRRFLMCLTLAPLIRLVSLSLPLPDFPFIYWYMVVGAPLFLATYLAVRVAKMTPGMLLLSLPRRAWPLQALVALVGLGLGYCEYIILRPTPLISGLSLAQAWVPAIILLIFTGFLEELIFRGMLQYVAMRSFGRLGFVYVAMVFAVLHLGYRSIMDVVFVFLVAVFFGWIAFRTKSIIGVSFAHGLTNITLYLVFPFLVAAPLVTPATVAPTQPASIPGLLAPVPTLEVTRAWVPPTGAPTNRPTETPTLLSPTQTAANAPSTADTIGPGVTSTATVPQKTQQVASPTATHCGPPAGWFIYVIQPGDTLSSLSARAGISIQALKQANCLKTDLIKAGATLYTPVRLGTPTRRAPTFTASPTNSPLPSSTPRPTPTQTLTPTTVIPPTFTLTPSQAPTTTSTPTETPSFTAETLSETPTE